MSGARRLALCAVLLLAACAQPAPREPAPGRDPAVINMQLGVGYLRAGRRDLALERLTRALQQNPKLAAAHNAIAVLHEQLGDTEKADRHYRQALALAPGDSRTHNNFGRFLCRGGRLSEAEGHFLAAVRNPLYESPQTAWLNAGLCARRVPDPEKARRYLQRALDADPLFAPALLELARLSEEQGRYMQARGYLQRYQGVAAPSAESLWLGIRVERALGDRDAVASYRLLLEADFPDSPEARRLAEEGVR